ncbi:hypothetical protein BYT27DRAFT_6520215 [Phlegmacium glaucopus]|nr:hypothetical protein BYT27DRAFT_6520215 [Phlegmacium glaucopus]
MRRYVQRRAKIYICTHVHSICPFFSNIIPRYELATLRFSNCTLDFFFESQAKLMHFRCAEKCQLRRILCALLSLKHPSPSLMNNADVIRRFIDIYSATIYATHIISFKRRNIIQRP